jgi:hypothetical protein
MAAPASTVFATSAKFSSSFLKKHTSFASGSLAAARHFLRQLPPAAPRFCHLFAQYGHSLRHAQTRESAPRRGSGRIKVA